MHNSDNSNTQC